jgi:hypothetical protein
MAAAADRRRRRSGRFSSFPSAKSSRLCPGKNGMERTQRMSYSGGFLHPFHFARFLMRAWRNETIIDD